MTFKEILNQLEGLGTEQNRKIYLRHGSGQNTFGVSFANLKKLSKGLGRDHELAVGLWDSDVIDAQVLATMIADPHQLNFKTADAWLKQISYPTLISSLAGLVSQTSFVLVALKKWSASKKEAIREAGYDVLSHMLKRGIALDDKLVASYLDTITKEIHHSPNWARYAMNNALIAIGTHCAPFKTQSLAAAKKIGAVTVDQGDTSCKTPDAYSSIMKSYSKEKKTSSRR